MPCAYALISAFWYVTKVFPFVYAPLWRINLHRRLAILRKGYEPGQFLNFCGYNSSLETFYLGLLASNSLSHLPAHVMWLCANRGVVGWWYLEIDRKYFPQESQSLFNENSMHDSEGVKTVCWGIKMQLLEQRKNIMQKLSQNSVLWSGIALGPVIFIIVAL